jgi:hypothetical protein
MKIIWKLHSKAHETFGSTNYTNLTSTYSLWRTLLSFAPSPDFPPLARELSIFWSAGPEECPSDAGSFPSLCNNLVASAYTRQHPVQHLKRRIHTPAPGFDALKSPPSATTPELLTYFCPVPESSASSFDFGLGSFK